MSGQSKNPDGEQLLLDVLCDVASVVGQLRQRLARLDDVTDERALAHAAEAICLSTLDEWEPRA